MLVVTFGVSENPKVLNSRLTWRFKPALMLSSDSWYMPVAVAGQLPDYQRGAGLQVRSGKTVGIVVGFGRLRRQLGSNDRKYMDKSPAGTLGMETTTAYTFGRMHLDPRSAIGVAGAEWVIGKPIPMAECSPAVGAFFDVVDDLLGVQEGFDVGNLLLVGPAEGPRRDKLLNAAFSRSVSSAMGQTPPLRPRSAVPTHHRQRFRESPSLPLP